MHCITTAWWTQLNNLYKVQNKINKPRWTALFRSQKDTKPDNNAMHDINEQEAQLPQRNSASAAHMEGGGLGPPAHSPFAPSGYTNAYGRIRKPQRTYVKRAVRKAHFKMNRALKVIQGHPYWCRHESRTVCCRNVQLIPTLFLKLTKIRQREHSKFVDFNDLSHVWRRPSKKRIRISTNGLYCQKLQLLAYIFVADSVGLHSLVFT